MIVVALVGADAFAGATHELLHLNDFYWWHLLDSLPSQRLTTLRIDAPYDYTSRWVGALVLALSIIVILPLVAWIKDSVGRWRNRRDGFPRDYGGASGIPNLSAT